jgi:pimeloyl-ACP methyl ester carboxylesterase
VESETVSDLSQGVPLAYMRELCAYWAEEYDFDAFGQRLRRHTHLRTEIDGLGFHAVHVRSKHQDATPIVLTHGWPGSFLEFSEVIDPLVDPTAHGGQLEDAFHVVCPSLPGYGFSDRPTASGWNLPRIADAWAVLMARLGYDRYVAQGGDWGAMVTTHLAWHDPDHVAGIHLNMAVTPVPPEGPTTPAEEAVAAVNTRYHSDGSGYMQIQGTRPQTLGYGLVDSPAALAAWIVEKLWAWSDSPTHVEESFSKDQILDLVGLYWFTETGASSARLYWETRRAIEFDTVTQPVAVSLFPAEIIRTTESWAARTFPNLRYSTRSTEAGTSPPGNNPPSSSKRCASVFAPSGSAFKDSANPPPSPKHLLTPATNPAWTDRPQSSSGEACWVQILDAPIDLRLLGKRQRGGTKGRRLDDETSILPSHRWSYPTHWRAA